MRKFQARWWGATLPTHRGDSPGRSLYRGLPTGSTPRQQIRVRHCAKGTHHPGVGRNGTFWGVGRDLAPPATLMRRRRALQARASRRDLHGAAPQHQSMFVRIPTPKGAEFGQHIIGTCGRMFLRAALRVYPLKLALGAHSKYTLRSSTNAPRSSTVPPLRSDAQVVDIGQAWPTSAQVRPTSAPTWLPPTGGGFAMPMRSRQWVFMEAPIWACLSSGMAVSPKTAQSRANIG